MNTATCPRCKNAYSQTSEICDFCQQAVSSESVSDVSANEPANHSKPVSVFVHVLAAFSGIAGFFVAYNLHALLRFILMPYNIFMEFYGIQMILGSFLFVTFLILGALFGFVWNKGGWKLGISLGGLVVVFWVLVFPLDVFSGNFSFTLVVSVITNTFPVLAGSCLGAYFGASYKQKRHRKGKNFQ
jgi:hypothetical protein